MLPVLPVSPIVYISPVRRQSVLGLARDPGRNGQGKAKGRGKVRKIARRGHDTGWEYAEGAKNRG